MDRESIATEGIVSTVTDADNASRRSFLQRSAVTGAGVLAVAVGGSNMALAQESDDEDVSDVDVLNFALTLEHLEYAFYRDSIDRFCGEDYRQSAKLNQFGTRTTNDIEARFAEIRDHEETHVDTLTTVVEDLGGEPVDEACYEFGLDGVDDFLAVAAVLENTGVSAYAGAAPSIQNPNLIPPALSIHSVEARHAAYLNLLNGDNPFPMAFDEAKSMDAVLEAAGGFIVECQ